MELISFSEGIKTIVQSSMFPIVGQMFHPFHMLVSTHILGKVELDESICGLDTTIGNPKCITSETYVAAYGLASSFTGIILMASGYCFILGLNNILPQAYGAGQHKLCGAYLNRMLICVILLFTPLVVPMMFSDYVFRMMNQPEQVVMLAHQYVKIVAPSIVFFLLGHAHIIYATHMGLGKYNFYTTALASVIHCFMCSMLFDLFENKMTAISIATSTQFVLRFVFSYYFVHWNPELKKGLIPLTDSESFEGLGEVFKLGTTQVMLNVNGWWAFDILTQMTSFVGEIDLAGQVIMRNIGLVAYMIPLGLAVSCNHLTGKYIG